MELIQRIGPIKNSSVLKLQIGMISANNLAAPNSPTPARKSPTENIGLIGSDFLHFIILWQELWG